MVRHNSKWASDRDCPTSRSKLIARNHIESDTGLRWEQNTVDDNESESGVYLLSLGRRASTARLRSRARAKSTFTNSSVCARCRHVIPWSAHIADLCVLDSCPTKGSARYSLQYGSTCDSATGCDTEKSIRMTLVRTLRRPCLRSTSKPTIVTFLDRKTAQIDTLIAKKQRLIELLQEKRQALISHVVTKGLDPNVPRKDSGVEWIGTMPRHWNESPRTRLRCETGVTGHTPSRNHPEYWVNRTVPWITLADVWQLRDGTQKYIRETNEYVSDVWYGKLVSEAASC